MSQIGIDTVGIGIDDKNTDDKGIVGIGIKS